ncbi:MAG: hypothetical protein LBT05_08255, partial [Planctomycetaceae bacterium]|nr:hypothetical protein [Planctomycetaceae bacterium]
ALIPVVFLLDAAGQICWRVRKQALDEVRKNRAAQYPIEKSAPNDERHSLDATDNFAVKNPTAKDDWKSIVV